MGNFKLKIAIFALAIYIVPAISFASITVTPNPVDLNADQTITCTSATSNWFTMFGPDGVRIPGNSGDCDGNPITFPASQYSVNPGEYPDGGYWLVEVSGDIYHSPPDEPYLSGNYSLYESRGVIISQVCMVLGSGNCYVTPSVNQMINDASTGYGAITGSTISSDVNFVGSNLIELIIGSGLSLLVSLLPWILAFTVIGIIVFTAYRTMKDLNSLR